MVLVRRVETSSPIDPLRSLRFHRVGRHDRTMRVDGRRLALASHTPAGPVALVVERVGERAVELTAHGAGASYALDRAPSLLGVDDHPETFDPSAGGSTSDRLRRRIERMVKEQEGLRLGRALSLFDVLVRTVLQQRVTWIEATRAQRFLVERYGEDAPLPGLRLPIRPEALAELAYWELHPAGIERHRAEVLRRLAKRAAEIETLAELPYEEAKAGLFALPGIGPWSVGSIAGFGLGDPDAVPVGDYHLPNLICTVLAGEPRGDDERMLALLDPWKGQRFRLIRLLYGARVHAERRGPKMAPSRWTTDERY
jgi:3-methyladenine DNA glycosylase/8-oxoguanine DNA glycosylase